jgi:hypothetical protein
VTLEVGYTKPYEDLLEDANIRLEGSQGQINLVILVKISPLGRDDEKILSGFVELFYYNETTRRKAKKGHVEMDLYLDSSGVYLESDLWKASKRGPGTIYLCQGIFRELKDVF